MVCRQMDMVNGIAEREGAQVIQRGEKGKLRRQRAADRVGSEVTSRSMKVERVAIGESGEGAEMTARAARAGTGAPRMPPVECGPTRGGWHTYS